MRYARASSLAAVACAIALPSTALHAQSFASLLEFESGRCTVDTHAEVGGNGANESDGFGGPCEPTNLFEVIERFASAHEEEGCNGNSGAARSTGWIDLFGGPRSTGEVELWLFARAHNQASGGCGFDSRSTVEVHLQWRVNADVEIEYQPLFPCESNGRDITARLTIAGQVFDLRESCALAPVRLALEAGTSILLDARLDETRDDKDTELGFAFRLREALDAAPPLAGLALSSPAILNTNAGTDSMHDWAPEIATDGDETWVTVWSSTNDLGGTIGDDSDILFARSTDGGLNWSDPRSIADHGIGDDASDLIPKIAFDGRGSWVAGWHSEGSESSALGPDQDILFALSLDGGATWSAPRPVDPNATTDAGDDRGVELASDGDGSVVAAWEATTDLGGAIETGLDILYARSRDGGATWTEPAPVDPAGATDSSLDSQASLATNGNGDWVVAWLATNVVTGVAAIHAASSRDDALSWSAPLLLNPSAAGEQRPEVAFAKPGRWMVVWPSFGGSVDGIGGEGDLLATQTVDLDGPWGAPFLLDAHADRDSGTDNAPAIASLGEDRFVVVWSSNEPSLGGVLFDRRVIAISGSVPQGGFSEPRSIVEGPQRNGAEARQPALAIDPSGHVVIVWRANALTDGSVGPDDDIFFAVPEPRARWLGVAAMLAVLALRRAPATR